MRLHSLLKSLLRRVRAPRPGEIAAAPDAPPRSASARGWRLDSVQDPDSAQTSFRWTRRRSRKP